MPRETRSARASVGGTALDHATCEAARAYADQLLNGTRRGFPLLVHDDPVGAVYRREAMVDVSAFDRVGVSRLDLDARTEIATRAVHERLVVLAGAIAFRRCTGQSDEAFAAVLATIRDDLQPLADSEEVGWRIAPFLTAGGGDLWMTIDIRWMEGFLDRNGRAIAALAAAAVKAPLAADGWRILPARSIERHFRRHPVELSDAERSRVEVRQRWRQLRVRRGGWGAALRPGVMDETVSRSWTWWPGRGRSPACR